jgi:hypothetical protein
MSRINTKIYNRIILEKLSSTPEQEEFKDLQQKSRNPLWKSYTQLMSRTYILASSIGGIVEPFSSNNCSGASTKRNCVLFSRTPQQ